MADGIFVPPHLQIDPLRPVQFFTQGAATGVQAGEARNRAQQAAAALAAQAQARAAEQQIAEMRALSDAAQFSAELALRKEENQQAARLAATRYEAAENIRRAIAGGTPPELAMFQNPQFFLPAPSALANIQPPFDPEVLNIDGTQVLRLSPNRVSRLPTAPPEGPIQLQPMIGPDGEPVGLGFRTPTGAIRTVATPKEDTMTPKENAQLSVWRQEASDLRRKIDRLEERNKTKTPEYTNAVTALKGLNANIKSAVTPGTPKASPDGAGSTGKVRVRNPDGRSGWIPESQLEEALANGYQLAPAGASGSF